MVLGWRRAFCTSVPTDQERDPPILRDEQPDSNPSPRIGSRFGGFFSNPSTPRLQSGPGLRCRTACSTDPPAATRASSAPQSPKLRCKTAKYSSKSLHHSTPSSPRSHSPFSVLRSSLRLSKQGRCEICLDRLRTGQGTAIFTAGCRHSFHFPCIAAQVRKQCSLTCPVCNSEWKDIQLLPDTPAQMPPNSGQDSERKRSDEKKSNLKVYNDDEPLSSPTCGARFNPIPESDENEEFPGFFVSQNVVGTEVKSEPVEFRLLPETAVVSVGKSSETHVIVLKIKAPPVTAKHVRRAPIDLVTVLDVSRNVTPEKLHLMKRAMRLVVSSLSAADRLSIVAFSTASKRLLPLRRMTTPGRRAARRIIDAIVSLDDTSTSANDSVRKAVKVMEDRREKNPVANIMLISNGYRGGPFVSQTIFSDIPLHSVNLSSCMNAAPEETFTKCITDLLSTVILDLKIQLGFKSGPDSGEIAAIYSAYGGRPTFLGSGSTWCTLGDLHSEEEREVLIELKVRSPSGGNHRRLSVRFHSRDPSTQEPLSDKQHALLVPRPRAVGSSVTPEAQRLRCLFVTTRAMAESRRLADRNDIAGAHRMLAAAQALILQSGSDSGLEFIRTLDAELADLKWRRQERDQVQPRSRNNHDREADNISDYKAEPLTPTSAWKAAERLAKVAMMKKSLSRVSDLHGFENARF